MALWDLYNTDTDLWLYANDASTRTIVTGLSNWEDRKSNGLAVSQETTTYQPAVISAAQNSLDIIRFDGSNDFLTGGDILDIGTGGVSIFVIGKFTGFPTICAFIAKTLYGMSTGGRYALFSETNIIEASVDLSNNGTLIGNATKTSFSNTAYHLFEMIVDRTNHTIKLYIDGSQQSSISFTANTFNQNNSSRFLVGAYPNSNDTGQQGYLNGDIGEIIIIKQNVSSDLQYKIEGCTTWRWGLNNNLPAGHLYKNSAPLASSARQSYLDQGYSLSTDILNFIDEIYGLKLGASLLQPYIIYQFLSSYFDQTYGLRLESPLNQIYFDSPVLKSFIDQNYRDANQLFRALIQTWGDAARITGYINQEYDLPDFLRNSLVQKYALTAAAIRQLLVEQYNLSQYNLIASRLEQTYIIAPAGSLYYRPTISVVVDGIKINPSHINIECSRDENVMTCEMTLYSQIDYLVCELLSEIVIIIDAEEYHFLVNPKPSRNRNVGETTYTVRGESRAILLDAPFSEQIKQQIGPGMASALVSDLATMADIDIQWEIVDWYIPADTLYANDETPLSIIRKIVAAAGAILQSDPDGTLRVSSYYPFSVPDWLTNTPDFYLTDQDNFFTLSENPETRPGYNKYTISDQLSAQSGVTLEEKQISDTVKEIKAYQVPWDGLNRPLLHSGGPWVRIEPMGSAIETITAEQIEIVNGTGKTSKPIYAMIHREYKQVVLGVISFSEDGTLKTEIVGESLVKVTYQTMYWKFQVTDNQKEAVQCYVEELNA
jgi:hypothetical protein